MPLPSNVILTHDTSEKVLKEQQRICFHLNNLFGGTSDSKPAAGDDNQKTANQKSKSPDATKKQKTLQHKEGETMPSLVERIMSFVEYKPSELERVPKKLSRKSNKEQSSF